MTGTIWARGPGVFEAYQTRQPYDLDAVKGWLQQAYRYATTPTPGQSQDTWAAQYNDLLQVFGVPAAPLAFDQAKTIYGGLTPDAVRAIGGTPAQASPAPAQAPALAIAGIAAALAAWWWLK